MKLVSDQVTREEIDIILRLMRQTLQSNIPGDVVEFGCYVGTTSLFLQQALQNTDKQLHVYDSFEGLPDKTAPDESPVGIDFTAGKLRASKNQLVANFQRANLAVPTIHKGWFSELTNEDIPDTICFAFLDGDYYESIYDSLIHIWKRMSSNSIIVVDDYISEALPGAKKAVDTWLKTHSAKLRTEAGLAIIQI